jgi:hypothetical protein
VGAVKLGCSEYGNSHTGGSGIRLSRATNIQIAER